MNDQKPTVPDCKLVSIQLAEIEKSILIPLKHLIHVKGLEGTQIVTGFSYDIFSG